MLSLIVLSVVLLFIVTFALQNPQVTTARFLFWELEFSVAVLTLAGAAAGVILAESFRFANRLLRWKRGSP
jgi:uncharacterized integral membrane protein